MRLKLISFIEDHLVCMENCKSFQINKTLSPMGDVFGSNRFPVILNYLCLNYPVNILAGYL